MISLCSPQYSVVSSWIFMVQEIGFLSQYKKGGKKCCTSKFWLLAAVWYGSNPSSSAASVRSARVARSPIPPAPDIFHGRTAAEALWSRRSASLPNTPSTVATSSGEWPLARQCLRSRAAAWTSSGTTSRSARTSYCWQLVWTTVASRSGMCTLVRNHCC